MASTGPRRRPPRAPRPSERTSARGLESEMRILEACRLSTRPTWMRMARRASRIEDRSGIDIVVESDVGTLALQVKSSAFGKERFRPRPLIGIAVIVVGRTDGAEALLAKVVAELEKVRAGRQQARQGAASGGRRRAGRR